MPTATTSRASTTSEPSTHAPFPGDPARLELLRGGQTHCASLPGSDARVSVIVLAPDARAATGAAVRAALTQSHPVHQVLVVGPEWSADARATLRAAASDDARVRLLAVPRPGLAPAAPRARRFVRAVQYLRAALPHITAEWALVCGEAQTIANTHVAALLHVAREHTHELAWLSSAAPHTWPEGSFAGVLWCSALADLPPHEHAGWDGLPSDRAWWQRLLDAGVRAPAGGFAA